MGYAPPYYLRLRIYARQVNYFYRKLRLLPPVYDNCPARCLAPEADRLNGCPDCDFTVAYKRFESNYYRILKKELARELIEIGVDPDEAKSRAEIRAGEGWTFESLQEDYRTLSELEAMAGTETEDHPGGVSPDWSVRTKAAIDIMRDERYKVRREVNYEREQEREAKARADKLKGR